MAAAVSSQRTERLPGALLAFAVALAFFMLVPPLLTASVGPPAGFTLQEAIDLLTPLIVIPLAWYVFDLAAAWGRIGPRRVPGHRGGLDRGPGDPPRGQRDR